MRKGYGAAVLNYDALLKAVRSAVTGFRKYIPCSVILCSLVNPHLDGFNLSRCERL